MSSVCTEGVKPLESIDRTLAQLSDNENFGKRMNRSRQLVFQNDKIQAFLREHPEIDSETVDRSMAKLFEFANQSVGCGACPNLGGCINVMKGYQPVLFLNHGQIDVRYERCPYKIQVDERREQEALIQSLYVPREILRADMESVDLGEEQRQEAIEAADEFTQRFQLGKTQKGLYFHGKFGVGKTYLMGAIANELAKEKGVRSLIVYTPDFFREMKASIGDQTVNEKLDYIKRAPVLILDDIGAETISSWVRDDLLGTVLQYRMMEEMPTLYTSNYDYDELEDHLAYSHKTGTELLKAKRIMERIRHLTVPVQVGGENRRTKK